MTTMTGRTAVVVGGSRGLGLGVALAARDAGARVVAVARTRPSNTAGLTLQTDDATDEAFAEKVLAAAAPALLVITAGAVPPMGTLREFSWESFSVPWHADVRIAFTWLRAALRTPMPPGSRVVVFGSAAELRGSPLSGGYAGAKATVRLITGYAAGEAAGLGITMTTVLPVITPATGVGETAIHGYAARSGSTADALRAGLPSPPTAASVGAAVLALAAEPDAGLAPAYRLDGDGLHPLDPH